MSNIQTSGSSVYYNDLIWTIIIDQDKSTTKTQPHKMHKACAIFDCYIDSNISSNVLILGCYLKRYVCVRAELQNQGFDTFADSRRSISNFNNKS
jgi:hypothetical protein